MTASSDRRRENARPRRLGTGRQEMENARWLAVAVGEFVCFAELTSIYDFLDTAGITMSLDALTALCDELAGHFTRAITAAPR
jgi:hypothetical protein